MMNMKCLIRRSLSSGALLTLIAVLTATAAEDTDLRAARQNSYKTADQIKQMLPCTATIAKRAPCYVVLKTPDGKEFSIGSPGNTPQLDRFIGFLKEGKPYKFPEVFFEFDSQTPSAPKYRLELVSIFDAKPPETAAVIVFPGGGFAFKSLESLKKFVGTLPQNSTLEWAPGCEVPAGKPLFSSESELMGFKEYCKQKQINFIFIPAG